MDCFDIDTEVKKSAIKQANKENISKAELYRRAIASYLLMKNISHKK